MGRSRAEQSRGWTMERAWLAGLLGWDHTGIAGRESTLCV